MINMKHLRGDARDIRRYIEHRSYYGFINQAFGGGTPDEEEAGRAPGAWHGRGAQGLNLSGEVGGEQLQDLLNAKGFGRQRRSRPRLGTDVTVSSPKTVSIAALALGDIALVEEHDAAVCDMVDYLERKCVTTRCGKGGHIRLATGNLTAAIFRHEDARPVNGVSDPDLHSHAIVANLTRRHDGTWRTVDLNFGQNSTRLYLANQVYLARLACGARNRCGYAIEQGPYGFELAGIDESVREAFSQRRRAVDARLTEWGTSRFVSTYRQRATANHVTRGRKNEITQGAQRAEWRRRAARLGLRRRDLPAANDFQDARQVESLAATAVAVALERTGVVDETEIIRSVLGGNYGRLRYEDAVRAARDGALAVEHGGPEQGGGRQMSPHSALAARSNL